jgi:HSF-type DNA-binding
MASSGSGDSITKQDKASSTFAVKEVKEKTTMSQSQKKNRRVISVPADVPFIQPGGQALQLSDVVAAENKAGEKEQEGSSSRIITSSDTTSQEEKTTGPQHELSQSLPESSSSAVADAVDVTGALQNNHVARSLTGSLTVAATPVSITSDSIPAVAATAAPGAAVARPFKQSSATSATSSSSTSSRTRFPDKLHRLLDHCSNDPVECRFVSWMGNRAFKVHEPKQFAANILPRYFSTTTYKSFQRNLNLW